MSQFSQDALAYTCCPGVIINRVPLLLLKYRGFNNKLYAHHTREEETSFLVTGRREKGMHSSINELVHLADRI